jgi:glycosyltransferase involved in cell wall biosynthesis
MPKNILVLNYEFPPLWWGASPVSYEISKWYVELWYNVDVITMWFWDLAEFEVLDWINIHRVKCLRTKKQVCYPWEQLTYIYSWYKKAKQLLKQKKYDICHCHFIIPTWVIAQKLKKNFWLNYIITAHWSDVLGHNPKFSLLYKILKNPWKNIIKNSKNIISPSRFLKNSIEKYYWKSDKIVVIPNWIDKNKFQPLKKQKYILTVARLQKWKAIQDLLEAVKDIDLWEWKIKIVWEWPYEKELKRLVKKYDLEKKVNFLWWIDNKWKQMKELYWKASIFCQPSYFENASIVLLEAMQSWCALIARNTWWNPETVNKKWLFNNISDLKKEIKFFIKNETLLEELQKENINRIKKFEWNKIILDYDKNL